MTLRLLDPHSTQQTLWESNPPHCPPQVADQRVCSHHREGALTASRAAP